MDLEGIQRTGYLQLVVSQMLGAVSQSAITRKFGGGRMHAMCSGKFKLEITMSERQDCSSICISDIAIGDPCMSIRCAANGMQTKMEAAGRYLCLC